MHIDAGTATAVAAVSAHCGVHNGFALFVTNIHFCTVIDEILNGNIPTPERCGMQRCLSVGCSRIHISSRFHQRFNGVARSLGGVFGSVEASCIGVHRTHSCSGHN